MKLNKGIVSLLLALCLLAAGAAFAEEPLKAIQMGTNGISNFDFTKGYDYIYLGNWTAPDGNTQSGSLMWRVLHASKTNMGTEGLFLMSQGLLGSGNNGDIPFDDTQTFHQAWQGSTAQTWCKNFANSSFTTRELAAILETTKSDGQYTSNDGETFMAADNILNGDKVFFLSAEEAEHGPYFSDDDARSMGYGTWTGTMWWLRSAYKNNRYYIGIVDGAGEVGTMTMAGRRAARPAFNLDKSQVLFTSAATGGKADSAVDANLAEVGANTDREWKLTLLDSDRKFFADITSQNVIAGETIMVMFSGAKTGSNEYVSAMIADASDNMLYYGRIAGNGEYGTVSFHIPADLDTGTYKLHLFSEQYNGDKKTDYASAFDTKTLSVTNDVPKRKVTVTTNGHGTASASPDEVRKYRTVTLTATPDEGYHFKEWKVVSGGATIEENNTFVMPDEDVEIRAIFEADAPPPADPIITDPTDVQTLSIHAGGTATMTVTAQNAVRYQWYAERNNAWVEIPGATGPSYTTEALTLLDDWSGFRCTVYGEEGTNPATSPAFYLRVMEPPVIPGTGDGSHPGLWMLLMLLSAACMTVMLRRRREVR